MDEPVGDFFSSSSLNATALKELANRSEALWPAPSRFPYVPMTKAFGVEVKYICVHRHIIEMFSMEFHVNRLMPSLKQ